MSIEKAMEYGKTIGNTHLLLKLGDITTEEVDVIVNAANSSLLGGGGVDGAIHHAGGPAILEECKKIRAEQKKSGKPEGCPVGQAVITKAGRLKAKYVVHTVGPDMRSNLSNGDKLLHDAYANSLQLASQYGKTVAFPSISTGIYSFPIERAAKIALETVREFLKENNDLHTIQFILFDKRDFEIYKNALNALKL
jgi:O-acetyl-ADP-ribose deacetylase